MTSERTSIRSRVSGIVDTTGVTHAIKSSFKEIGTSVLSAPAKTSMPPKHPRRTIATLFKLYSFATEEFNAAAPKHRANI